MPLAAAASPNQNYVVSSMVKRAGIIDASSLANLNVCELNQTIQYFDGLGRSLQTVTVKGSPALKDIVQPVAYDAFGRETTKYLSYADAGTANGSYKTNALTAGQGVLNFYNPTGSSGTQQGNGIVRTVYPFSQTVFEASPLNRVLEQGAPGAAWQPAATRTTTGRTVVSEYGSNVATGTEAVKLWVVTANGASCGTNTYAANKLYKTRIKDENWTSGNIGTVDEYKDFDGRVVLKRMWETETVSLSTYYVYDDFGNLKYVVPPAVTATSFTAVATDLPFSQFIYAYNYDGRQRVVEKKIPGKDWEYLVYNKLDQVVLTQDGVQRGKANQSWTSTKYDVFGRVIMTGVHTYGATANTSYRTAIQTLVDAQANQWEIKDTAPAGIGYTITRTYPPLALNPILSIQYYDDYAAPNMPAAYGLSNNASYSKKLKGLPTASRVSVLGTTDTLWTVNYYDDEARVLKTYKQHYQSGAANPANYDEISNTYNFAGELLNSTRQHRNGAAITTIANAYEYDHMGRKKLVKEKINTGDEVVLSRLNYNEVGQLLKKELHSTDNGATFLQNTQYTYNERGWLKTGTSAQFSNRLKYEDGTTAQYNGNIANQDWGAAASLPNVYTYSYDRLNRLLNGTSTGIVMSEVLSYDVMGNIKTMNRDAAAAASLYNYTGNRLTNITGGVLATGNYSYDVNGNATTDGRTGVVLTYNLLNLPATAKRTTPAPIVNLAYTYDAAGSKLRKVSTGATAGTRHYVSGIEYDGNTIDIIQTEEGFARNNAGVYSYEYNLTDHLGNVRYTFNKHPTTGVIQRLQADNYYAFGKRKVVSAGSNKYLYNGKEIQDELGEQYDYGARFYDPVIGRWNVVDNKAEAYESVSPYVYAVNDPVNAVDPDGNLVIFVNGFVPSQWLNQNNRKYSSNGSSNPYYRPYPPSRALTNNYPQNLGKSFDYWGDIDNAFMQGYNDNHSMYINGSSDNTSNASDRFSEGVTSANNLISQLDGGKISLADGETIKIVGHSQGGAFAAGMASVLSKNKKYASVIQEVVYLEPHQPADFNHPSSIKGIQISSPDDLVASKNIYPLFKGETSYSRINGIRRFITNDTHKGDSLRGHSVGTNLDEIANYFRSLGVKVTVTE